jgi:FixJ family two-component response regulator
MEKSRLRVAVIDDDESVRKALKRLLRAVNLDADAFASGREFLDSWRRMYRTVSSLTSTCLG